MKDLRSFVANAPVGPVIDLGSDVYSLVGTFDVREPMHSSGATIHQAPSTNRNCSILRIHGAGMLGLTGDWNLVGAAPAGAAYNENLEAQHGIEFVGAANVNMPGNWTVSNVFGDGAYFGMDRAMTRWTDGVTIGSLTVDQIGRQGITVAAGRRISINHLAVKHANRSVIDIEPPGVNWGAEFVAIDAEVWSPNGYLFADKGAHGSVHDILIHALAHGRLWNTMVDAPAGGTRRANFKLTGSADAVVANTTPIRIHDVDGVHVEVTQRLGRGVVAAIFPGCTNVT